MSAPTILDVMTDRRLFGRQFRGASWDGWKGFLAAVFGLDMPPALLAVYQRCTARTRPPTTPVREAWAIVGRRGGKSRMAALVAVYLACFRDYRAVLVPGEVGTVMLIAADRRQARVLLRYVVAFLGSVEALAALITRQTEDAVTLSTGIVIEIHTASFRSVRGYTVVGAVLDEVGYWRDETSANPDVEILAALRPAMSTVPGALLLGISTPYVRRGVLFDAYRQHYGREEAA